MLDGKYKCKGYCMDGDVVPIGLAPRFQKAFWGLCSDIFEPEELAHEIAIPLKETIKDFGNLPVSFLDDCYEVCENSIPANLGDVLDRLVNTYDGDIRGIEIARRSVAGHLDECRSIKQKVTCEGLFRTYLEGIYRTEFEERIPLGVQYNNLSIDEVRNRLADTWQHINGEIKTFTEQIIQDGSTGNLRRRVLRSERIGLHDDAY